MNFRKKVIQQQQPLLPHPIIKQNNSFENNNNTIGQLQQHHQQQSSSSTATTNNNNTLSCCKWLLTDRRIWLILIQAMILIPCGYMIITPIYFDPFLGAIFFCPFRYIYVSYFDDPPSTELRTFYMNQNNTFVINRKSDVERIERFRTMNSNISFTHFIPPDWYVDNTAKSASTATSRLLQKTTTTTTEDNNNPLMKEQRKYEKYYPWLKYSSITGKYGNAGCSYAHILLLEQFIAYNNTNSYIYAFEDDVVVLEPLRSQLYVQVPSDADVVYLPGVGESSLLRVAHNMRTGGNSLRVVYGYGAFGYVITYQGAKKMLKHLQIHNEPIDRALSGSWNLRVYLAIGSRTSLVHHYIDNVKPGEDNTWYARHYLEQNSVRLYLNH